jgi:2-polyprenyl-3-methyl-5-hydroxy-6-metoxy-1,4-benzoquinol methylase
MPPPMIDLSNQPCPVCGRTASRVFHQTTYPEHGYPGEFILRRCEGCGLLFNSPRLDLDELGRLYGRNYYFFQRKDSREFERIVAMYQRTVGLIDANRIEKRCIDIGCGRGYFPAILTRLVWDAGGIEISPEAAAYARGTFGLDVFTGTVEQYASSTESKQFPLVTAIDVIEHVPSPADFVAAAARIVAPRGTLIIDTPNAAAHNIAAKGVRWKGFNPFHIYLLSVENLATLLARNGMTVERSFSYGNSPLDECESMGSKLRDAAIHGLKKVGLLGPAVRVYFGIRNVAGSSREDTSACIDAAVSRINSEPPYTATPDSTGPLAAGSRGDNIVVVARKL